jgi:hypothetical protein
MKRLLFAASTITLSFVFVATQVALSQQTAGPTLLTPSRGGPKTEMAYVQVDAPVFVLPDATRQPLRVAKEGSVLRLLNEDSEWCNVDFDDPQFGRRVGYIQKQYVVVGPGQQRASEATQSARSRPQAPDTAPSTAVPESHANPVSVSDGTATGKSVQPQRTPASQPVAPAHESATLGHASIASPIAAPSSTSGGFMSERDKADAIMRGTKMKGRMTGLLLQDSEQAFASALSAGLNRGLSQSGTNTGFSLRVYTPKAWLMQLAADAAKEYRSFTVRETTDEMLEPVLRVVVYPDKPTYVTASGMLGTSSVQHVILRDEQKRLVVQPSFKEDFEETASNAMGGKAAFQGLRAQFPMDGVRELRGPNNDREFYIVVIGSAVSKEKEFKVKQKHFASLP